MTRVILGLMRGDGILEGNESLIVDISVIINENWWRGGGRARTRATAAAARRRICA